VTATAHLEEPDHETGPWALVKAAQAGDMAAFGELFDRYYDVVYRYVLFRMGDRSFAEDVAQETFVRACRHAGSYDARRGRVATWLLTIARNAAIDAIRVRKPEPLDPDVLAGRLQAADGTAPPDDRDRVGDALAGLPEPQRRALFLAVFAGRTAREIAELEHAPLGTVKTRIRAAMATLRTRTEAGHEL